MPSTQEITDRVLSGEGVQCYYDSRSSNTHPLNYRYTVHTHADLPEQDRWQQCGGEGEVKPVIEYLCDLRSIAWGCRRHRDQCPTYEDIYYLAGQIAFRKEQPNPLIGKASETVLCATLLRETQRRGLRTHRPVPDDIRHRATEELPLLGVLYLEGVVTSLLSREPADTTYLMGLIGGACDGRGPQNVDVVTLNHDRVIDAFLEANSICYDDGFERQAPDGFRRFSPEVYSRSGRVRVLKLHGAVDWIQRSHSEDVLAHGEIGVATDPLMCYWRPPESFVTNQLPIQIGTYNKITNYTLYRHLSDLQCQFMHSLDSSDCVVVAGYSFGDAGINARLRDWASKRGEHCCLAVVDPCLSRTMRSWTCDQRSAWAEWKAKGILCVIEECIERTTWGEIARHSSM